MTELKKFFDILVDYLAFERTCGRDIVEIEMSLKYMLDINSHLIPYTIHFTNNPIKGILKSILGIPVFVDVDDTSSSWIKYTTQKSKEVNA